MHRLFRRAHVRALSHNLRTRFNQSLCLLARDLVLGRTWKSDVDLREESPRALPGVVVEPAFERVLTEEALKRTTLELEVGDRLNVSFLETSFFGDKCALGV